MKKYLIILFLMFVIFGQIECFGKSNSRPSRSAARSPARATYNRTTSKPSSGSSTKVKVNSTYKNSSGGTSYRNVRTTSKSSGNQSSKAAKSFNKGTAPKPISKYISKKTFATPRTVTTSGRYHHRTSFIYTRPIIFYNPYRLNYYALHQTTEIAKADTSAFPGFGNGKAGGAGAESSFKGKSLNNETSKNDSLEITELKPINYLSDYAGIVPDGDEPKINSVIRRYAKRTGVEIAILTVPTLGDEIDMADYIQVIFDRWGIGMEGVNNGVLIIISSEDELVRMEPGYGLEDLLPDAISNQIDDNILIPLCEEGKWEEAISGTVAKIISTLGDKTVDDMKKALAEKKKKEHEENMQILYWSLGICALVALIILGISYRRL